MACRKLSLGQYYNEVISAVDVDEEDHIAIVYAQGSIVDGKGSVMKLAEISLQVVS